MSKVKLKISECSLRLILQTASQGQKSKRMQELVTDNCRIVFTALPISGYAVSGVLFGGNLLVRLRSAMMRKMSGGMMRSDRKIG